MLAKLPRNEMVCGALLLLAFAFATFVRVRLADIPLERDEGEYAYAGQLLIDGVPPYKVAYNMKLPGTYLAYAAIMKVLGETPRGIHLGVLLVNLATIALLYGFTREMLGCVAAAVAAMVYAIVSVAPNTLGFAGHATHFVTLFGVAGSWVLWRAMTTRRGILYGAAGLLMGAAFVMKQHGMFLILLGFFCLALEAVFDRPIRWRRLIAWAILYATAAVLPYALTCLWLWHAGVFDRFWFWTVVYARHYVSQLNTVGLVLYAFTRGSVDFFVPDLTIWALALVGCWAMFRDGRGDARRSIFVAAMAVCSFLCVVPGFYFREHYWIVTIPSMGIIAGWGTDWLLRWAVRRKPADERSPYGNKTRGRQNAKPRRLRSGLWYGLAAACAILIGVPIVDHSAFYFQRSPDNASTFAYGSLFVETARLASIIERKTEPNDTIAVLGSEPQLYFLARRRAAMGYIYTYAMMEVHPFARQMQDEAIAEFEAAKPKYVLAVNLFSSWVWTTESDRHILEWATDYVPKHYDREAIVEMNKDNSVVYRVGPATIGRPRTEDYMILFRRKSSDDAPLPTPPASTSSSSNASNPTAADPARAGSPATTAPPSPLETTPSAMHSGSSR